MHRKELPRYTWYQYHTAVEKYRKIHSRIENEIQEGKFWQYAEKVQRTLLRRLRILYKRLLKVLSGVKLGTAAATVAFMVLTGNINAQSFTEQTGTFNPLNGYDVGTNAAPSFVDIDNDGDFDVLVGKHGGSNYYKNLGSDSAPSFTQTNLAGLSTYTYIGPAKPDFVDIDGDGDFDAFMGRDVGNVDYFKNYGNNSSACFGFFTTPLYTSGASYSAPNFVDIDNDGDFDAFVGLQNGSVQYYENFGTATGASFLTYPQTGASNPLNGVNVSGSATPSFVDIDSDNDLDVFIGAAAGVIRYFENIGSASAPVFTPVTGTNNPLDAVSVGSYSAPDFVDIDDDGDMDAFIGDYNGNVHFFENDGAPAPAPNTPPVIEYNTGTTITAGDSFVFTREHLWGNDAETSDLSLLFKVTQVPAFGKLMDDGTELAAGDTFEQRDLYLGKVSYMNTGFGSGSDSFGFKVVDADGATSAEGTFDFTINAAPPTPPTGLNVQFDEFGNPVLGWNDNSDNEDGFRIFRQSGASAKNRGTLEFEEIASVSANTVSYTDDSALEGESYSYQVVAYNADGSSEVDPGEGGGETTAMAPLKTPTELTAVVNDDGSIMLDWSDNSSLEDGYKLERKTGASGAWSELTSLEMDIVTYTDEAVTEGETYSYRIKAFNDTMESGYSEEVEATSMVTGIEDWASEMPTDFELKQNYPNPFNPSTKIAFGLPNESNVKISVFNILGQHITTLVNRNMSAGYHEVEFDASNLKSGVYVYKIDAQNFTQIKKMMLLK